MMITPNVSPVPQLTHDVAEQALAHFAQSPHDVILTSAYKVRDEQPQLANLIAAMMTLLNGPYAKYDFTEGVYLTWFLLELQAHQAGRQLPFVSPDDCRAFLAQLQADIGDTDTVEDVAERRFTTLIAQNNPELAWAMNEVTRYRVGKSSIMVGILVVYCVLNQGTSHLSSGEAYEVVASA
ncbi:MAG: hypothetical protein M3R24_19125 [Chloroflexota bacterium]|nr:hypothetical protein [Chloroflexota bacterium]